MVKIDNELIEIKVIRDNGEMKIYVKTCVEFEDYLKKTRGLVTKSNFCNTEEEMTFYDGRTDGLSENVENDSAIRDLINYNRLNFAVLRVKDISRGQYFKITKLIALDDLNVILRRFLLDFKNYYKDYIKGFEISATLTYKDVMI